MDPLLISLVSACTALVASVVGPLVTLAVAKRQFNATVLSANRQKWIEALRDKLAELISLLVAALVLKEAWTIATAFKRLQSEETRESKSEADVEHITRLAQSILKREWERVKQGT